MLAEQVRQPLGAAAAGNDSQIDFRLAEAGVLSGDDDVAAHRQLAAAAQGKADHRGDHRLGDLVDLIAVGEPFLNHGVEGTLVGHFFDVGAGGEDFVTAGDDDDAHFGVLVELLHGQRQIFDQAVGQRIERLRTVQSNHGDGAVFGDDDVFVIHLV